jgi:hypothetical protein
MAQKDIGRKIKLKLIISLILLVTLNTSAQDRAPVYIGEIDVSKFAPGLKPWFVKFKNGNLYISYLGTGRIDVLSQNFRKIKTIELEKPVKISSFDIDSDKIFVADNLRGEIFIFDRDGKFVNSFGFLPDGRTRIRPFNLSIYAGNLYVTDLNLNSVLVISADDIPNVREEGELLFIISEIKRPYFARVTPDGRILVSDAGEGKVKVFTCNGKFAYSFESARNLVSPAGIAFDDIQDKKLLQEDRKIFDPSGVRRQGRIHISDIKTGTIHVYNSLGYYIFSYGDGLLEHPVSIDIDTTQNLIVISEPGDMKLKLFKY